MKNGRPVLAILGYGRAGKDTTSEWFREHTVLKFTGGSSWVASPYMAERLSKDEGRLITYEEAYISRHKDRDKWKQYLDELRAGQPTYLIKKCLEHSDIVCGLRDILEVKAGKDEGLLDLCIWIERPGVAVDPTVTFGRGDADIVLYNDSDLATLYTRLRRLSAALGVLKECSNATIQRS